MINNLNTFTTKILVFFFFEKNQDTRIENMKLGLVKPKEALSCNHCKKRGHAKET